MSGRLNRLSRRDTRLRSRALLERCGLADAAKRAVKSYSGGMRRKLDLAASLMAAPVVLFLDEPTAGLDPFSRAALWDIIGELVSGGTTLLLTTQYLEEADRFADDIVVLDQGRVVATGSPQALKARIGGAASRSPHAPKQTSNASNSPWAISARLPGRRPAPSASP